MLNLANMAYQRGMCAVVALFRPLLSQVWGLVSLGFCPRSAFARPCRSARVLLLWPCA